MKNIKQIKFGVLIATIIAIAIIGTIGVKKMNEPTEKERQIAFLKEHEEEMTKYVKSKSSNIKNINYLWDTTEKSSSSVFTKENLSLRVEIKSKDDLETDTYSLVIDVDVKKLDEIKGLFLVNWKQGEAIHEKS